MIPDCLPDVKHLVPVVAAGASLTDRDHSTHRGRAMNNTRADPLLRAWAAFAVRVASGLVFAARYSGTGRWCPVCEKSSRRFARFGVVPRKDARCGFCGSLERHRFVWLFFSRMTNLFDGKERRVLHVAPEE